MPTKSQSSKTHPELSISSSIPKIKKLNFSFFGKINITYILFALLIIAAYLLGVLVTKVQYLENGVSPSGNTVANADLEQNTGPTQPTGPVKVDVGNLPPLGDENAPVTLVEFSDFECPFCEAFFTDSLPQIKKEYIDTGKAKLYFRHYPLTAIHPNAQIAAEASECANDQDQFWNYHDKLFINQTEWTPLTGEAITDKLVEYATTLGLSADEFRTCLTTNKFADNVNKDIQEGSAAGVDGTPATFINGYLTVGAVPFAEFKAAIEARLEDK
jgi:protein-disulfide isomerase